MLVKEAGNSMSQFATPDQAKRPSRPYLSSLFRAVAAAAAAGAAVVAFAL